MRRSASGRPRRESREAQPYVGESGAFAGFGPAGEDPMGEMAGRGHRLTVASVLFDNFNRRYNGLSAVIRE